MTEPTTLFRAEWGSRAYGTNNEHSDRDIIQVVIERPEHITGLSEFKAKNTSTAATGERSTSEDTDTVIYGLQKYAGLAVAGNPQVMATLFLDDFIEKSHMFNYLQNFRSAFVSKQSGKKYLGYMKSQRYNLEGLKTGRTNRPELVHTHGYDTKFAMHAARLGYQGLELMRTGSIHLPMTGDALKVCKMIRAGEVSKDAALTIIKDLEADLEKAVEATDLPDFGDKARVSELLHDIYMEDWNQND